MLDTTLCLDLNYYLLPETTIEGTIYLDMVENMVIPQEGIVYFVVCLMLLSVTRTTVREKVEVFQQDLLPSFSSFVQPNLICPWILCPLTFLLGVHKTCSSWNKGTGKQF